MSAMSPNKYGVLIGAKAALLGDANVKLFTSTIEIIPRDASLGHLNIGRNSMILLRDGGATRAAESTLSVTWEFTTHIAIIDIGGDINRVKATQRVMAARQDICEVLDRNIGIYDETNTWIETAHVTDVPEVQKIWSDIFEQADDTPFTMEMAAIKYLIYCQEG